MNSAPMLSSEKNRRLGRIEGLFNICESVTNHLGDLKRCLINGDDGSNNRLSISLMKKKNIKRV